MKVFSKIILILVSSMMIWSCDMFSTRTPEPPDTRRSSYQPPTEPDIVISNFLSSIKEKNAENYLLCFTDEKNVDINLFSFIPSADAITQYPILFNNWNRENEYQSFFSIISMMDDNNPNINFSNFSFEILLADSAIYFAKYNLNVQYDLPERPHIFSGALQFTLKPDINNFWSIHEWVDFSQPDDTVPTWSILKALFVN